MEPTHRSASRRGARNPDPVARELRRLRPGLAVVFVFSLVLNLLALVSPFYMLQVYDRVLTSGSFETLAALSVLAIGLLAVAGLLELARATLLTRLGNRLEHELGPCVLRAQFRDRIASPETAEAPSLRDVDRVKSFLAGPGFTALFDTPWAPAYVGLLFLFHPALGGIALGGVLCLFALALAGEVATRGPVRRAAAAGAEVQRDIDQTMRNAEVAEALGMERRLLGRVWERNAVRAFHSSVGSDRSGALRAVAKVVRPGLQIAILGYGAHLALLQEISAGVMVAASLVMGRALAPVEVALAHWRSFVGARGSLARLRSLLADYSVDEERTTLPEPKGRIAVQRVAFRASGAVRPTFSNVSFTIEPGELIAVVGPSGSGKSSLARLLVGVWRPSIGHVRLDGAELSDWNRSQLGREIGYLPQTIDLLDGTVAENIARFADAGAEAVVNAARAAGAHEAILSLPAAYETQVGDGGRLLSGGERQKVAFARALFGDPKVIVLDEPDAHLDAFGSDSILKAIARLRGEGRTVVCVTHDLQRLSEFDRALVVERGEVRVVKGRAQSGEAADAQCCGPTAQDTVRAFARA